MSLSQRVPYERFYCVLLYPSSLTRCCNILQDFVSALHSHARHGTRHMQKILVCGELDICITLAIFIPKICIL